MSIEENSSRAGDVWTTGKNRVAGNEWHTGQTCPAKHDSPIQDKWNARGEWSKCVIGEFPEWGVACLNDFLSTVLSTESQFPCTFAVAGAKKKALRFAFVELLDDQRSWEPLVSALGEYLDSSRGSVRETSFVVFFRPEKRARPLLDYYRAFWSVLQFLHDRDPEPWPRDLPAAPADPWWEFAFRGIPMFVVCNNPAHQMRASRYSSGMVLTFQPRWVFAGIEADTPRGMAARRVIRKRLRAFDAIEPSPYLGDYGDADNREWRQYFLPDDNTSRMPQCPFDSDPG